MLEIDTSGIEAYTRWLDSEVERLQLELRVLYRSWAMKIFSTIVELSPQWSGNLAANWAIDVNSITTTAEFLGDSSVVFRSDHIHGKEPYSRGMEPAVGVAMQRASQLPLPTLQDVLFIHNPVEYADEVENDSGERRIRPINRIPRSETGKVAMVFHAYTRFLNEPAT